MACSMPRIMHECCRHKSSVSAGLAEPACLPATMRSVGCGVAAKSEGHGLADPWAVLAVYSIRCYQSATQSHECRESASDSVSGVGGRRGTNRSRLALFRPPLPKRSVQLASHCAFQRLTTHDVGDGTTVLALGITPTALFAHRRRLCPFPL